jgi:RhtB (resistance to homoserine/threonine) family protein
MDNLTLILTVSLLNLIAAISPGPDFVMAVRNSLSYSRRTGIYTGIGIGMGIGVHIIYCAAGIGFIISKSILLFTIIKYVGAAYLFYLGVKAFMGKGSQIDINAETRLNDLTPLQALKMGFFTNILNPKATLFFLGLFTMVINQSTPVYIVVILAFIMILTAMLWFTLVAIFFTQNKVRNTFMRFENTINKFFGGLLMLLAIKIALTHK